MWRSTSQASSHAGGGGHSPTRPRTQQRRPRTAYRRSIDGINSGAMAQINWRRGELIGSGSFGAVHRCLNLDDGSFMAVKEMDVGMLAGGHGGHGGGRDEDSNELKKLRMEVELMRELEHPNIVRYLGTDVSEKDRKLYIFTEWVAAGSIQHMINQFGPLSLAVVSQYTRQMLLGLQYLHSMRIIHRDIKPGNVLVDDVGTVKLADFGASRRLDGERTMMGELATLTGTPYFLAPEVLSEAGGGRKADLWSLGGTVMQMLSGEPPWKPLRFERGGGTIALMHHIANSGETPLRYFTLPGDTGGGIGGEGDGDGRLAAHGRSSSNGGGGRGSSSSSSSSSSSESNPAGSRSNGSGGGSGGDGEGGHEDAGAGGDAAERDLREVVTPFLAACFLRDPKERPRAADLLGHPFVRDYDDYGVVDERFTPIEEGSREEDFAAAAAGAREGAGAGARGDGGGNDGPSLQATPTLRITASRRA